jgi:ferrous iron transport protein A
MKPSLSVSLDQIPLGRAHVVERLESPSVSSDWVRRLEEIGFMPGERVMLMARGAFGGDPLVVRVGLSTFALRRAEAACIHVGAVA